MSYTANYLTDNYKKVFDYIRKNKNSEGEMYVCLKKAIEDLELSKATISRALRYGVKHGILKIVYPGSGRGIYKLLKEDY